MLEAAKNERDGLQARIDDSEDLAKRLSEKANETRQERDLIKEDLDEARKAHEDLLKVHKVGDSGKKSSASTQQLQGLETERDGLKASKKASEVIVITAIFLQPLDTHSCHRMPEPPCRRL